MATKRVFIMRPKSRQFWSRVVRNALGDLERCQLELTVANANERLSHLRAVEARVDIRRVSAGLRRARRRLARAQQRS